MDFSFFTTDNKSGYKTNEKWLKKNHPSLYQQIIEYSQDIKLELNFKEKIWFFYNNLKDRPKCITCNTEIKFRNRFDKPYGEFCSLNCINSNKKEMIERISSSIKNKYGVEFYPNHSDFVKKQKNTKLLKYGDENFNNHEQSRKTKLKKYQNSEYNNFEKYKETCLRVYGSENYSQSNHYKNKITTNFKNLYPNINFVDIKKEIVVIKCDKCDNNSELTKQLLYERYKRNYVVCTNCNPIGSSNRSGYEQEVCEFLDTLRISYITNQRIPNKNTEIDVFIPKYNLGIEINGVYWHNELFKPKNYHLQKSIDCNINGITLIQIFEDEWLYKKEIVKSILLNKLGVIPNKIFARNCEIKKVNTKESKKFLEDNHIQGSVNSKVRLGLFYNNELVSLMTFSQGRVIMGGKKTEWELNRFCNKLNTNVIGAASKLLKHFVKNYESKIIVSYSDNRFFKGEMYEKLGFILKNQTKPNYWYVVNDIRKHRFNYRKSILIKDGYDKNLTEQEIMLNRKIYRIYDCGNIRWELLT